MEPGGSSVRTRRATGSRGLKSFSVALRYAVPILALLMLALTVAPADVWQAPSTDAAYSGFDPNLVYASGGNGGSVLVDRNSTDIAARPDSHPTLNLFTTSLQKVTASLDVALAENSNASEPFRIGVWSPWTGAGQFVLFGPAPQREIVAETISDGSRGTTLVGGTVGNRSVLGHYEVGMSYHLVFNIDRSVGFSTIVSAPGAPVGKTELTPGQLDDMFGGTQFSLTASASPGVGSSHVILSNYTLTLPHQRVWASKIDDPRAATLLIALAIAGGIAIAGALFVKVRRGVRLNARLPQVPPLIIAAVFLYLIGNALFFPLGSHPFDMGDEQMYAYVARMYGASQLYFLPNLVTLPNIWLGTPFVELAFPYEPVTAYLSSGIGWLNSILAGGGAFAVESVQLQYMIKSVNVLFGLGDAALIYLVLRQIGTTQRWSLIPAGLFLFNPAVWFSMSIWGQTHVVSLFFVLAASFLAEKRLVVLAWVALAAACLTRPQMLVFGLLLGIVFLRKFSWRENLRAVSWTVIATFLALAPLTLVTSPSLPIDIMLHNFNVQQAGGNNPILATVSQGAYSIWPLITYLTHGPSSLYRLFMPSSETLAGSITYQRAGLVLTVAALLVIAGVLWLKSQATHGPGAYLPYVALGIASFLMLLTGIVSTHFLLALPFLLLCSRWLDNVAYFFIATIWTVTTLVPMFGDMGVLLSIHPEQVLAPAHNSLTRFVIGLYQWDRFITVGVVANICAVVWLAILTFRPARPAPAAAPVSA